MALGSTGSLVARGLRLGALGVATVAALGWAASSPQVAQQERCDLMENQYVRSLVAPEGGRITYISGPVRFECADGTTIRADSAVEFSENQFRQLLGDVAIDGPRSLLTADRVNLSVGTGRTQAWGDVRLEDREADTEMYGDTLVFLEERDFRDRSQLRVWGERPYAVLRFRGPEVADTAEAVGTDALEEADSVAAAADSMAEAGDSPNVGGTPDAGDGDPVSERRDSDDEPDAAELAAPDSPATGADDQRAGPGLPAEPADTVYGDRLYLEGRSRFLAGGDVRVRRPDLEAAGDSLDYDDEAGRALLLGGEARPVRITGDAYDLTGREVELGLREGRVDEVLARENAVLDGRDVRIRASRIRIFLAEGEIDRLVAVHDPADGSPAAAARDTTRTAEGDTTAAADVDVPGVADADTAAGGGEDSISPRPRRAEARAEDFLLTADSIDVLAPRQQLERVTAVRRARGESLGRDTLNAPDTPELVRRDWIEGDTVVAHFVRPDTAVRPDAAPPADTGSQGPEEPPEGEPRLDRLVASGNARSLYRMASRAGEARPGADSADGAPPADRPQQSDTVGTPSDADLRGSTPDTSAVDGADPSSSPERRRPALHYVVGDRITIVLREGDVERMEVEGRTRGLYLEPREAGGGPAPDTIPGVPDTAPAVPDTIPAVPDTAAAVPDTTADPGGEAVP